MEKVGPFDTGTGAATYGDSAFANWQNGNPGTGTEGSIPPFEAWGHPNAEIVAAIEAAGLTPASGNLAQLAAAIKASGLFGRFYSFSAATTLTVAQSRSLINFNTGGGVISQPLLAPGSTAAGTVFTLRNAAANVLTVTTPSGSIILPNGVSVTSVKLPTTAAQITFVCDGTNWLAVLPVGVNPRAEVYLGANFAIPTSTFTNIFSTTTVASDVTGMWDNVNKRFTIHTPGQYQCFATLKLLTPGTPNGELALELFKNGNSVRRGGHISIGARSTIAVHLATYEDLAAGDYIDFRGFQNTGGNQDAQAGQSLTWAKIMRMAD